MGTWTGLGEFGVTFAPAANQNAYSDRYGAGLPSERLNIRSAFLGFLVGVATVCITQGFMAAAAGAGFVWICMRFYR